MKTSLIRLSDDELHLFCLQAAMICNSKEFKQLHKEMLKMYRKLDIRHASVIAFQDSLYSLFVEENAGQYSSQNQHI